MKIKLLFLVLVFSSLSWGQVFTENMGTPTGNTAIAINVFQNTGFSFSGTADVRITSPSLGYSGFSAGGNIFFTNTIGKNFQISGIDTSALTSLTLSLGHFKSTTASSNELVIEVSSDGVLYNPLTYTRTTGTGTANWALISPIGTIPSTTNLRIRFTQSSVTPTFRIDDVKLTGIVSCTPTPLTTVTPVTGPIGTEVSINAASGLSGATATFNGIVATVVSSSATQLVVKIPAGATTGNLIVTNAALCASLPIAYTIINEDVTSCESTGVASSDLIIYEIHDEFTGTGGTITLYNNTATTKTLSNYRIFRTSNQGDNNEVNYATLSGTIAAGALGIIKVNGTDCGPISSNGTITLGFNAFDGIQLRSSDLVTVIDNVYAPNNIGYYMKRNAGAFTPRTSFVATDWSIITLAAGVCATGLGTSPTGLPATIPSITAQPTISLTCSSTTAVLTVDATEGFVGGNPLAYQWFAVAPNATNWTALSNGIPYSGVNTNSLSISSVTGLNGYQFYCQVRENLATCYLATVAVKLIIGASTSDWNGTTWDNGAPTLVTLAIISGDYDMSLATLPSIDACSLSINSGTVTVSSGKIHQYPKRFEYCQRNNTYCVRQRFACSG